MGQRKLSIAYASNKTKLSCKTVANLYIESSQQVNLSFIYKFAAEVYTNVKVTVTSWT